MSNTQAEGRLRVEVGAVHQMFRKTIQLEWRRKRTIDGLKERKFLVYCQLHINSIILERETRGESPSRVDVGNAELEIQIN
jgi:hypothetical protein